MSDDYLWDGSGTPDPDVQRLEALLGRLRAPLPGAPAPSLPAQPIRWRTLRYLGPALATAAAVLVMIGLTLRTTPTASSWEVASLAGQPRVGSSALAGTGRIAVGQTLVTDGGSQARVTVGASCRTDAKLGPGTPSYDDADAEMRRALDEFDLARDPTARSNALRVVLDHAGPGDAMTLWHLIARVDAGDRAAVVDALAELLPMPAGVTREAVLRLDAAALDQWWNALGLGEASWWRNFKAPYPAGASR